MIDPDSWGESVSRLERTIRERDDYRAALEGLRDEYAAVKASRDAEVERLRGQLVLALDKVARFRGGCQMCGAHEDDPCDCYDPQCAAEGVSDPLAPVLPPDAWLAPATAAHATYLAVKVERLREALRDVPANYAPAAELEGTQQETTGVRCTTGWSMTDINEAISKASWDLAAQKENALREAARSYLPSPLKWAVDHPRVLRLLYRLHRPWRPRMVYGSDLGITVAAVANRDGRIVITETFGVERDT